jgi:NAD(P)-dependent dehydrogenase (short-subunit alcohol dehydrogenase family)
MTGSKPRHRRAAVDTENRRVAIVTGANRGLGREIGRRLAGLGITVALAGRDHGRLEEAAGSIVGADPAASIFPLVLDVRDRSAIGPAVGRVLDRCGRVDILVNNAGILIDGEEDIASVPAGVVEATFDTNVFGPMLLSQAVLPAMRVQRYGRIVNMSSSLGSMEEIGDPGSPYDEVGSPAYRFSNGALNVLTALLARETRGQNVLVNAVCPGWVRTDMGTERAPLSVEEGADTPVWLATLPDDGPTGGFFRERTRQPW